MATKPNIRSIRFSDELAELIDRQAGNTFTEKFENLVSLSQRVSLSSPPGAVPEPPPGGMVPSGDLYCS